VFLSWEAPVAEPAPITAYVVTPRVGTTTLAPVTFDASSTSRILGGLTNGIPHTFTVTAINALGHESASSDESEPVIPGQQISGSGTRTCALAEGGTVKCWGQGGLTPTAVPGLSGATSVSVGTSACALISDGSVKCWGSNFYGELGNGTYTDSATPVTVLGITDATAIAVRTVAACALLSSGSVKCWGHYFSGQGGLEGDWTHTPWTVPGLNDASAIGAGDANTCVVVTGGAIKCWGNDISDGAGSWTWSPTVPVPVPDVSGATLVAGGTGHSCARLLAGTMKCWGQASLGQLGHGIGGDGSSYNPEWTPVSVVGMTGARVITAGYAHTCAITVGGTAQCWGRNDFGQVGNGTSGSPYPNTPSAVLGLSNAIALEAGTTHTCAVVPDAVLCWGNNSHGQLGTGSAGGFSTTAVEVVGL
jgi:alpha-tubulin suppressor-like RCC1 family protein